MHQIAGRIKTTQKLQCDILNTNQKCAILNIEAWIVLPITTYFFAPLPLWFQLKLDQAH